MSSDFLQLLLAGLTIGAVYSLVAVGFSLIYGASDVINFAQGEFVMVGGMTAVLFTQAGLPLVLALFAAVAVATVIGGMTYQFAVKSTAETNPLFVIILTIGVSIFLKGAAELVFGKQIYRLQSFSGDVPIEILGATISSQALWILAGSLLVMILVFVFFEFSLFGKALIALSERPMTAELVGINPQRALLFSFCASAAIGGVGGVLMAPLTTTSFDIGPALALKGFAAAVLGGLGSSSGAVIGGLLLGVLESFAAGYVSSTYKDALAYVLIIVVLLVFPRGLFNAPGTERV